MIDDLDQSPEPTPTGSPAAWLIGPAFLGLAAWFIYGNLATDPPLAPPVLVTKDQIIPGARRVPMGEPPSVISGGFKHACNECHRIFDSPRAQHRPMVQHTHISLRHGMNDNCFNCHDRENREKLVLYSGDLISFDQVPRLCAQCHGTVYRDWQRGTHGKTMGSWDAASGLQLRLECNDCHDPHVPAYPPIAPLPSPRTLRMGFQFPYGAHEHDHHVPLQDGADRSRKPAPHPEKHE